MIIPLTENKIQEVVALHQKVLGHTLNSRIGSWFLKKLYMQTIKAENNGFGFIYMENNKVLGFISFCIDQEKLSNKIKQSISFKNKLKLFSFLIFHPNLINKFIKNIFFGNFIKNNFKKPYTIILTIGVHSNTRGKGIGKKLINKCQEVLKNKNINTIYVDTEITNKIAIKFYQKIGFQIIKKKFNNVILKITT
ncbi:MAG: GNAT family N-acetyltransferase [Patescibacteria group bacterium]